MYFVGLSFLHFSVNSFFNSLSDMMPSLPFCYIALKYSFWPTKWHISCKNVSNICSLFWMINSFPSAWAGARESNCFWKQSTNIPNWDISIIAPCHNKVKRGGKKIFRLQQLRKEKGITQLKLAMDLGMSQNTISRYESEKREADYRTLILFADYFHVSVDYLLGRTDNPTMNV